jgi:uncharacterized damage-inducible protein DinB
MQTEIKRIISSLQATFKGDPWHGSSVMSILTHITAEQAQARPSIQIHSIWELVLHMIAWRRFTWQKLSGNRDYDISTPEQDWPPVNRTDEPAWQQTLDDLRQSQHMLLEKIMELEDEFLDTVVPGRAYTFYVLLQGIIQHDVYHSGQIILLKKHVIAGTDTQN